MDTTKNVIICSLTAFAAYFQPIQSIVFGVLWVLALNFICGLIAGIVVNKEVFNLKKAFVCVAEAAVVFVLMSSVFYVGDKIGNLNGAMQCITCIVYALIYFYAINVIRNLCALFPTNKLLSFIYHVISIEFVNKIPYLKDFLNTKK